MGFNFCGRFENQKDDIGESVVEIEKADKREVLTEDDYADDFDEKCEKAERKLIFSGTTDTNADYGKGGGKQYFIQDAAILKERGNLIPISKEICTFNPETDIYSPDIRRSNSQEGYLIHLDNRDLNNKELEQLDFSTSDHLETEYEQYGDDLSKEETEFLDENTPETDALTQAEKDEKKPQTDFRHPLADQEESNGFNHPDGWSNPEYVEDGSVYYQLVPEFKDKHETKSSYFTDKETIDSCRDENGNIVLSELMQTLQKSPNKEKVIDSDGNESEEYVTEYSVIQYKFERGEE